MHSLSGASIALVLHVSFFVPAHLSAASNKAVAQDHGVPSTAVLWQSTNAEHIYGLPDIKHNKKGTLTLSADTLTFTGKSGTLSIPRGSVTAVSAGNQRVELWGLGGRILRMTIPDGGGVAAAAVMHHRVDMLTVEFQGRSSGHHAAVFFLPANEAGRALQNFVLTPGLPQSVPDAACRNAIEPKSVLVSAPNWDQAEVPAAYRALVYEHLVDRMQRTNEVSHVYRDGEANSTSACPQYTVSISIAAFKEGSSVKRAFLGPAGMFVGTTQMKFDVVFSDASGKLNSSQQITATIRGDSESTGVADHVAKDVAKRYAKVLQNADKSNSAKTLTPTS